MNIWVAIFLFLHVFGAIVAFGPSFSAFPERRNGRDHVGFDLISQSGHNEDMSLTTEEVL